MNIARLLSNSIQEDVIDQLHHRRLLGSILQKRDVHLLRGVDQIHFRIVSQAGEHFIDVFIARLVTAEDSLDDGLGSNMNLDILPRQKTNVVNDKQITGVCHGNIEGLTHQSEGDCLVFLGDLRGDEADDLLGNRQS